MQTKKENRGYIAAVIVAIGLSVLACEPVIAIGWREIFIVLGLFLFLFGPPIYRFVRKVEKYIYRNKKDI